MPNGLEKMIENCLKNIEEKQKNLFQDEKYVNVLNNFYDTSVNSLSLTLSKENINLKKNIKEEIITSLTKNLNEIDKNFKKTLELVNKSIKDMIIKNYTNYLFDEEIITALIKDSKTKIQNVNILNKEFLKKYDSIFELFLYNISVKIDMKGDVNTYNLINKTMNQNKKILFDNLKNIYEERKDIIINNYDTYLNSFLIDVKGLKENYKNKNIRLLEDVKLKIIEENIYITVSKSLNEVATKITLEIDKTHKKIIALEKTRKNNSKEKEVKELKDYLLSFCNTLYDKSQNTLLKMNLQVGTTYEEVDKSMQKYQDIMYKIIDFSYNFDKPFELYKKAVLNGTLFLPTNTCFNMANLVIQEKDNIITLIRGSLVRLFEENLNLINKMSYKELFVSSKINNYFNILTKEEAIKLLEK